MSKCNCTPLVFQGSRNVIHKIDCPAMTQPNNTTDSELDDVYHSSGLAQIAFNSNGRDFFPETIRELLEWAAQEANKARIAELEYSYTQPSGMSRRYYEKRLTILTQQNKEQSDE